MTAVTPRFQSLGRDSVLSNQDFIAAAHGAWVVSIPRSGFCFVELSDFAGYIYALEVSIPRSGFCFVEPRTTRWARCGMSRFQSLGRDSVLSNVRVSVPDMRVMSSFQSLGRDSVLSNFNCHNSTATVARFQSLGRDSVLSNNQNYGD